MASRLVQIITAADVSIRNQSIDEVCPTLTLSQLISEAGDLELFRQSSENLYEKVRALFFLYAIHRFHIPLKEGLNARGLLSFSGCNHLLQRRFEEAIKEFLALQAKNGPSETVASGLATAYYKLGIQTLADQVRRSVRAAPGNQWMFRMGHPLDHPLSIRSELLQKDANGLYPILRELTPVRMDLTHSGWSDIFFLGMDYPEGAKVLNISIDLGVHGRDSKTRPPVEAYLRVIDEPVIRLTSVDLGATSEIREISDVFDFARDYLGLLKAALIASGVVPPGIEGSGHQLSTLLARLVGEGRGLEIVSSVNDIPKGSRLAVSTNLLAALIAVCMRATRQAKNLEGPLSEEERRLIVARAILGEWLGGSGGGWQDSGGLWPGIKLIEGALAQSGDPEFGLSRGRLLPQHTVLELDRVPLSTRQKLQESLVLVHGGMAQNVGPILEMVTEKYLLRSPAAWNARNTTLQLLDTILSALRSEDVQAVGKATSQNFDQPIQTIIPWATNYYTELLIRKVREHFSDAFWGFWMLGGMSGGGMGFIFDPRRKAEAQAVLGSIMAAAKKELEHALPFAMDPVVYDFSINDQGSMGKLLRSREALLPRKYYTLVVPALLRLDPRSLSPAHRSELGQFAEACRTHPEWSESVGTLFEQMIPTARSQSGSGETLSTSLEELGFDMAEHEQIRADLRSGRIGLAQNRLRPNVSIEDAPEESVLDISQLHGETRQKYYDLGKAAIEGAEVAVITLAAGSGSRWTQGAGVVKALHPFCKLEGKHRTFIEAHLAKSRKTAQAFLSPLAHVFTTSYLTHQATSEFLERAGNYRYEGPLHLSPGRSIGLRFVPMVRDLQFLWQETAQQLLDEQAQKVRESLRAALIGWARKTGEGSDYTDNLASQCLHPVGHWYEVPNLFRNGTLANVLSERPNLKYLLLHNIDTLGANVDPVILGSHISSGACLSFEVIARRVEDRGGGLARVNGRLRLLEGLAMPREEVEFGLSYYNSMTTWIHLDSLLALFKLSRADLGDQEKVNESIRLMAARMPTYITLKDVKKRWGYGQEDIYPVAQFEKLWGDMTALPEIDCRFLAVSRFRGQQLKEQAQLDGWLRDGSADYLNSICAW